MRSSLPGHGGYAVLVIDKGMHARTLKYALRPFTLVAATTRPGMLSAPLRERFGIFHHLDFYSEEELVRIVSRSATILDARADTGGAHEISRRSRGTPRIANRLLRRVRDYAQVKADGVITEQIAREALRSEGVDARCLDKLDRRFCRDRRNYAAAPSASRRWRHHQRRRRRFRRSSSRTAEDRLPRARAARRRVRAGVVILAAAAGAAPGSGQGALLNDEVMMNDMGRSSSHRLVRAVVGWWSCWQPSHVARRLRETFTPRGCGRSISVVTSDPYVSSRSCSGCSGGDEDLLAALAAWRAHLRRGGPVQITGRRRHTRCGAAGTDIDVVPLADRDGWDHPCVGPEERGQPGRPQPRSACAASVRSA